MAAPTFDVLRPTLTRVEKPTFPFDAATSAWVDPTSTYPLRLGEWLLRTANDELARPTSAGVQNAPCFPYWEWTGQTDVQVSLKGTILLPPYEAWTLLHDFSNPPAGYGDGLVATLMTSGIWNGYAVLRNDAGGGFVLGFALNVPASATSELRFRANY